MADMLETKIGHPKRGQLCLGALADRSTLRLSLPQRGCVAVQAGLLGKPRRIVDEILDMAGGGWTNARSSGSWTTTPRAFSVTWCAGSTRAWAVQGADIDNIGLMEDRAALRISANLANWIRRRGH